MPITRQEFNTCVQSGLKGRKFPDQKARRMEFCILAKMCAHHMTRDAATIECNKPKPPKPEGAKKRRKKSAECPEFDPTTLIPHCETQLGKMVRSGELPTDTDVTGICELILG